MSAKENAPAIHCESASLDRSISTTDDTARDGGTVSDGAQSSPLDTHDTGRDGGFLHRPEPTPPVPGFVALVSTPRGHYQRRVYLSLSAAEKAVARAHARGQYATIILCRLVPEGGAL